MRKCVAVLLLVLLAAPLGCGTLLYRERIGQPRGKLDVVVVLLDSIGLVYFVVPGLVAFAVDFGTGAIYLPRGGPPPREDAVGIQMRELGARSREPRAIEQALREMLGVELAGRWDEVVIVPEAPGALEARLVELDARARRARAAPEAGPPGPRTLQRAGSLSTAESRCAGSCSRSMARAASLALTE